MALFGWLTERRRRHLLEQPFPDAWTKILEKNVAAYRLLSADEQKRLRDLVQVFVAEKNFEGCGGLELTDEIRITIAGSGCQMLLGRDHDLYEKLISILVYPSTIVEPDRKLGVWERTGNVVDPGRVVVGLAIRGDTLVLAWDEVVSGARDAKDGRNVVVHELAHAIDFLDGDADGTPPLPDGVSRRAWAAAFSTAFLAHKARAERGEKSFLRDYAITNEAEYFAVASEVFFEKPKQLAKALPEVYAAMSAFYQLDLAAR